MVAARQVELYRRTAGGRTLTVEEREKLVQPYLPPPNESSTRQQRHSQPVRTFLKSQFHLLVYTIIHTVFALYIRLRHVYHAVVDRVLAVLYYHHRTPELITRDVKGLSRLPRHLSVILNLDDLTRGGAGLDGLVDDVAEIAAWCACAGIPTLSVYEPTGVLKSHVPATHAAVSAKFRAYFGRRPPTLQIRAPHMPALLNGEDGPEDEETPSSPTRTPRAHLSLLLLSSGDSRDSLVDLTKTLTEMCQRGKIAAADISPELVDGELSESVMTEPDLLVLFGPEVVLQGYPPWQVRLTEIL